MSEHFIAHGRPAQIIAAFCRQNGVQLEDLAGPSKTQTITRLRHELMYLMRQLTVLSQSDIGLHLGGRDMATVHAGIAKVADRMATNVEYRDRLRDMRDGLIRASLFREGEPANKVTLRVALSILTSKDLTDAEARQAAAEVLLKDLHPVVEVASHA
jgi:Bacterial dnaA protein helix-turn-helix